jgi:anaerobic selenocysteine-containing dehydrogenase
MNPPISYKGAPAGNPAKWINDAIRRGMKLTVIDPRRTDVARRAFLHLQPQPGEDATIVAGLLRVILEEGLYDQEFVAENVHGVDELRAAVEPFTSARVAAQAGVAADDLVLAARTFASGRGYAVAGTGPNMSGPGTLVEYLVLALDTLCGHYLRAGENVRNATTLLPSMVPRAQASPPRPAFGFGEAMRVRGLTDTAAGLPTAALPDEILLEGDGQVRALISCAGNPAAAWPDQLKTIQAMRQLELLVQIDPWMSATAKLAHYVIAPKMPLEVAGTTQMQLDVTSLGFTGYGLEDSYAHYSPPVVDPPPGSDLIEEWEFFWGVAQRMGLQLSVTKLVFWPIEPLLLDMEVRPATDELLECLAQGSRIPLDEVKRHPHGALFPDPPQVVAPREPGWTGRLDVGNPDMMRDLQDIAAAVGSARGDTTTSDDGDLRLIPRRVQHAYNSSHRDPATNHGKPYNPAFIHPNDVSRLGLVSGDIVEISSARASILAVVEVDATLREGLVSMTHCFGSLPDEDNRLLEIGSNTARLLDNDVNYQPYSGQPRMSNVPVSVRKWG